MLLIYFLIILMITAGIVFYPVLTGARQFTPEKSETDESHDFVKKALSDLELELTIGRLSPSEYEKLRDDILVEYSEQKGGEG